MFICDCENENNGMKYYNVIIEKIKIFLLIFIVYHHDELPYGCKLLLDKFINNFNVY
jgi:hypothetical protein